MTTPRVVALVAATALLASSAPAFGAPSVPSIIKRLDKREARHFKETDRRLKGAVALAAMPPVARTQRVETYMTQSGTTSHGDAICPSNTTLTGGGVDWGPGTPEYPGYHVVSSAPDPGPVAW
jgi:hypothetical protein